MAAVDRPIRVLVADDSELFRELLSRVVASEPGFEVVAVAPNGDEAAAPRPADAGRTSSRWT